MAFWPCARLTFLLMSGVSSLTFVYMAAATALGFVAGALLAGIWRALGGRPGGKRVDELHHRVRALEADLRVAQRAADQARAEREGLTAALAEASEELAVLRGQRGTHEEETRRLKTELQHECAKTARLRQELADRAEEMVRTHVQLRDVQNELGVSRVGSDVVMDQIAHLERERDDLNAMVEVLKREVADRTGELEALRPAPGHSMLVDC
jgi:chromosome segregation ATPase